MDNKKRNEEILKTMCDLMETMNVGVLSGYVEDINEKDEEEAVLVSIEVDKPGNLIGIRGRNLVAIQTVLGLTVKAKTGNWLRILVDINGYRNEQKQRLREMVLSLANKVLETKAEIMLPEMSSYERRLCHMVASEIEGVYTESEGEDENRHIVIKLKTES